MRMLMEAKIDCLDWALRHPEHTRGLAPPLPLPPAKTMQLLVGQAVEVLWPAAEGWYKALVESYDEVRAERQTPEAAAAGGRRGWWVPEGDPPLVSTLPWVILRPAHLPPAALLSDPLPPLLSDPPAV